MYKGTVEDRNRQSLPILIILTYCAKFKTVIWATLNRDTVTTLQEQCTTNCTPRFTAETIVKNSHYYSNNEEVWRQNLKPSLDNLRKYRITHC